MSGPGGSKALELLRSLPRVSLANLRPSPGSKKKEKRRGRGRYGGRKCGRGHKGERQRGNRPRLGFEGGQTPFYLAIPKYGFNEGHSLRRQYQPLSLQKLQYLIDLGRVDPTQPIDLTQLTNARGVTVQPLKRDYGIQLVEEGADIFSAKVNIEVQRASELAIATIEKNGGVITTALLALGVPITKPEPVPHTEQVEEPHTQAPAEETEAPGCAGSARLLVPKAEALPEGDGEEQPGGGDAGAVQGHGSLELGCSEDWLVRKVKVEDEDEEWPAGLSAEALLAGQLPGSASPPATGACKPEPPSPGEPAELGYGVLPAFAWPLLGEGLAGPGACQHCCCAAQPRPCGQCGAPAPPRPFACAQCGKGFGKKAHLTRHLRVHTGERPYPCAQCGRRFRQKIHLRSHQKTHTGERPFPCTECGRRFRKKTHLVRHQRTHTGERPYACACCGRSFAHKQHLLRHQQLHAEPADGAALPPAEQKPFPCPECGKSFSWKKNLTSHRRLHLEGRPFACAECGRGFSDKRHLTAHLRGHMGLKPYACPHCEKTFSHKPNLTTHQRTHTGERPFACPDCGRGFAHNQHLLRHLRVHTGERPFACPQCGRCFSSRPNLIAHTKAHAGARPFTCEQCGRGFSRKSHLARHQAVHTGTRPHGCAQCGKRFSSKTNLARHQAVHTGHRPYICTQCGKSFSRKTHLLRHERTHAAAPAPRQGWVAPAPATLCP